MSTSVTKSLEEMDALVYFNSTNLHLLNAYYVLGRPTGILLYLVFLLVYGEN